MRNPRVVRPSPPWHGAVTTGLLFLTAAWLLAYTLLDLPPLEAVGKWNYAGMLGLVAANSVFSQTWRGYDYVRPERLTPPFRQRPR